MNTQRNQKGMSLLGILAIMIMVGFFVMCVIRLGPSYFEYLNVRDIVQRVALDSETESMSIGAIRRKIDTIFNTNQIYGVEAKNVEIYRKKGNTFIDAGYEVRVPIMWRIDAVMTFDDLKYQVGKSGPLTAEDAAQ
ncbi:MAG: DUF4845 domain-containing protein [Halioglobus sp.]|nr:DUF4845 domain-containing protein [Halioglobus sp.]